MGNQAEVIVTRGTAGPVSFAQPSAARPFVTILANRGEENRAHLVVGDPGLRRVFGAETKFADGDRYSAGHEWLKMFFAKGGRSAIVLRVVGASAVVADSTIVDRAGSPLDTLDITAKGAGTWGNRVDVTITDGTNTNTFKALVEVYDFDDATLLDSETFDNLKMTSGDMERVNNLSQYVKFTDLGSVTAAPNNRPANAAYDIGADGSAATAGVDNNAPAAADIVGTEASGVKTGLKAMKTKRWGWGWQAAPDLDSDSTVVAELAAQEGPYSRQTLFSSDAAAAVSAALTQRADHDSVFSLFSYPRLRVRDATTDEIKTIPAGGLIAGVWSTIVGSKGPGKVPAGADFRITHAIGLETQSNGEPLVDSPVAETLLAAGVNPIWDPAGNGPQVHGGRAATSETAWQYANAGYLYNLIKFSVEQNLQQFVYDVADPLFFANLRLGIRAFMVDLHSQGAFNGSIPGPNEESDPAEHAFSVAADEDMLSALDKANGNVRVKVWFRPALVAETIDVDLAKQNEV